MAATDHERIWLQNAKDAEHQAEGRLWCQDKVWPDDPEDGEPTEYVRADLATTSAGVTEEQTPRVKQLEWRPHIDRAGWLVADVHPGSYFAWELAGFGYWSHGSIVGREVLGGLEAAKAASQADYVKHVLSALEASRVDAKGAEA